VLSTEISISQVERGWGLWDNVWSNTGLNIDVEAWGRRSLVKQRADEGV